MWSYHPPSKHVIESLAEMPHAVALGSEVLDVLRVRHRVQRDALDDLEAVALQAAALGRVVAHQPHRGDAEVDQDLGADAVLPAVDRQTEIEVGIDRVAALV